MNGAAKVAINGLGRIGRATLKLVVDHPRLELVGVNDLVPPDVLAYLVKYDTVYGRYDRSVTAREGRLVIGDRAVPVFSERDPSKLPWGELGVDVVFECTGVFTKEDQLRKHLDAGAKNAILSAPAKSDGVTTVVHAVNAPGADDRIISCASCTTNCITPVTEVLHRRIGIAKATMTTIHAYTSNQSLVDAPNPKDPRRGRAGAANIVPTSTGAAVATTLALPDLAGRFDGAALRVPVPTGSIADIVYVTKRPTTVDEVNAILREEAGSDRYRDVLGVSDDPIVSSDIVGDPRASIVDLAMTQVVDGDLVKVMTWYDNEWGYTNQMIRQALEMLGKSDGAT